MVVMVVSLMEAGEAAEVGSCLIQHDGTFVVVCCSCGVVIQGGECELTEVMKEGHHIHLGEHSSLFEITIGQVAHWIVHEDDLLLDVGREGSLPESGGVSPSMKRMPPIPSFAASTEPITDG